MKEKLAAMWNTVKEHKAAIVKVAAIVIGAGVGVVVGAMLDTTEEEFDPDDLTPEIIEESDMIEEMEDESEEPEE